MKGLLNNQYSPYHCTSKLQLRYSLHNCYLSVLESSVLQFSQENAQQRVPFRGREAAYGLPPVLV
jgi:hypothetical protein